MRVLNDLIQDVRFGVRVLSRSPGFLVLVVLSLALGIGANAAIFSLGHALFRRPLPVRDPAALVFLTDRGTAGNVDGLPEGSIELFSRPLYERMRAETEGPVFQGVAAQDSSAARGFVFVRTDGGASEEDRAAGRAVSTNYFDVLGVPALRGRTFAAEDGRWTDVAPVVLGHGYWQRRFGGDMQVLGARLSIDNQPATVVGIAAPGFAGLDVGTSTDFWLPLRAATAPALDFRRENRWLRVVARLAPGLPPARARAAAELTLRRFLAADPELAGNAAARAAIGLPFEPAATGVSALRDRYHDPLLALTIGVAVLLLVVCLNVSHLLLARGLSRAREIGIRTALGASRARLFRQLCAEGLLLALLGALGGALVTGWLADGLGAMASGSAAPFDLDLRLDAPVLWFIGALALGTALAMGLVPAWQASRAGLQASLRASGPGLTAGPSRRLLSRALLGSQVAFSLVLLVAAALLGGSLGQLRSSDKGFDEQGLLLVNLSGALTRLPEGQAGRLNEAVLRRVRALPGVRSASLSGLGPLGAGRWVESVVTDGKPSLVRLSAVSAGYFETLGTRVRQGRGIGDADSAAAPRVAVVNEAYARQMLAGGPVLGARLRFDPVLSPSQPPDVLQVVGVVEDARNTELREPARPMVFLAAAQRPPSLLESLQVRTAGDPALLGERVRQAVREAHPDLRVVGVRTMRMQVERLLVQERLLATLATGFGLAALFLMSIGLYGVVSQWAGQRTREIGVRIALGASHRGVRWLVLRQALLLVLAGVAVGAPAALAAARLLRGLLFGLHPLDPRPLLLATLVLFAVAAAAAYLPARRASRVDPMQALRSE